MQVPVVDARGAPLVLVALTLACALVGCEVDLERVRVYLPFDAGALDDAETLCEAVVDIDLNEDGIDDLVRTYTFAPDGTLRTLVEEAGGANPRDLQDDPPEIGAPRETAFVVDADVPHRVLSMTRLDAFGGAALSARAGFVEGRLRTSRTSGRTTTLGPRLDSTWTSGVIVVSRAWTQDETGAWATYRALERAIDSGTGTPIVSTREEVLDVFVDEDSIVGELTRTSDSGGGPFTTGQYVFALHLDNDGVPIWMNTSNAFGGAGDSSIYDIARTAGGIEVDVIDGNGAGARTGVLERGPRGHVYRVQRAGSLVTCRVAITDPLGVPLWLAAVANECAPLLEEELDDDGFARSVTTGVRRVQMALTTTCDDVCVLAPAPPLDDASALGILERRTALSPSPAFFESQQRALTEHVPACEVVP